MRQLGLDAMYLEIVEDDHQEFEEIVREALAICRYDAFITTGAVSIGKFDFVEEGLLNLDATICAFYTPKWKKLLYIHSSTSRTRHRLLLAWF